MIDEAKVDNKIYKHKEECRKEVSMGLKELGKVAEANVVAIGKIGERLEQGNEAFRKIRDDVKDIEKKTEVQGRSLNRMIGGLILAGAVFGTLVGVVLYFSKG